MSLSPMETIKKINHFKLLFKQPFLTKVEELINCLNKQGFKLKNEHFDNGEYTIIFVNSKDKEFSVHLKIES